MALPLFHFGYGLSPFKRRKLRMATDPRDYFNTRLQQELGKGSTKFNEVQRASQDKVRLLQQMASENPRSDALFFGAQRGTDLFDDAKDVGLSLLQGVDALAKLPAMVYDKATTGNFYGPETLQISAASNEREKLKSELSQFKTQERNIAAQEAGESAQAAVGEGGWGTAARVGAEFGTAFWEMAKDPKSLPEALAQQLPMLLATGGAGRLVDIGAQGVARTLPQLAATKAGQVALAKSGTVGAVGAGAVLQGTDVGSDTMQRLMSLPEEVWATNPEYLTLVQELGPEAAKQAIASDLSNKATLAAGAASLVSSALPGGSAIERALVGKKGFGGIAAVPRAFAGEANQEGIEEGSGRLFGNTAVQQVDATQDLFDGVGSAAGQGAFLGGVLGGGISAVQTAASAAVGAGSKSSDKQAIRSEAVKAAIESGDVSALIDPKNPLYAPDMAIAALYGNSQKAETLPEVRQANLEQASAIASELETQRDKAVEAYRTVSPEGIAQYKSQLAEAEASGNQALAQLLQEQIADAAKDPKAAERLQRVVTRLDRQLAQSQEVLSVFNQENQAKDLDVEVEAVKLKDADPAVSAKAADDIINLSMAIPERLDAKLALSMATDTSNSLTAPQRTYLKRFSEARAAENQLMDMGSVSQEIYRGNKARDMVGIKDYRANVTAALAGKNQKKADKELAQLGRFVADHNQKADLIEDALETNQPHRLISNGKGGWSIEPGAWATPEARAANGGLDITRNSQKLAEQTRIEAKALVTAQSELQSAYDNKFPQGNTVGANNVQNISQSSQGNEATTQPIEAQTSTQAGTSALAADAGTGTDSAAPAAAQDQFVELLDTDQVYENWSNVRDGSDRQTMRDQMVTIAKLLAEKLTPENRSELEKDLRTQFKWFRSASPEQRAAALGAFSSSQIGQKAAPSTASNAAAVTAPVATQEAPASSVSTETAKTTQGQLQSTEQSTAIAEQPEETSAKTVATAKPLSASQQDYSEAVRIVASENTEQVLEVPEELKELVAAVRANETIDVLPEEEPSYAGLAALQQKSPEGTAHDQKKLGDFFTQSAGKDTDGSKRPLVAVKDFMSAVAAGTVKISQYIKDQNLSEGSKPLVWAKFVEKAAAWAPIITRNLKPGVDQRFHYLNPILLMQDLGADGKSTAQIEENVKTAIAAAVFSYTADQAGRPELNDDKAINSILGRSKDSPVSNGAKEKLESVGVYQSQVIDSLGSAVMDALGFKLNPDVPKDMLAKLQVSLGAHALKLMEDQGLLVRSEMTNGEMNRFRSENLFEDSESGNQTNETASFTDTIKGHIFFKLAWDAAGQPIGQAKEIADAVKGSQSLIQNLFGIEAGLVFPSLTPPKGLQKESDTGMGLPSFIKKVFKLNQTRPWKANKDPLKVLSFFSEEEGMQMAGVEDSSEHTHRRNFNSKRAKNDGLIREFRNFMEFVGELATGEKALDQEFFLSQEMWKQQRSGYKSNTVNPNTSKIVRWLVAPDAWSTEISLDNDAQLQSFMLRASEGFGIKPEKADSQKAVDALTAMMQMPAMQAAVKALQTALFSENAELNEQQRTSIMTAVTAGKQKLHTLASLIAYARYQQAVDTGADSFTTNLMGEVDGVSNGSILNSIMYGAAATAEQLNTLLEKGGIYTLGSKFSQYNLWRGTPGHQDIYESNAQDLHAYVNSMLSSTRAVTGAIWATGGSPINAAQEATKDGRDLLKGPINPLNYGGGFKSIIGKMAYNYVDTIYDKLEGFSRKSADQVTVNEFVRNVNVLLSAGREPQMPIGKPIAFYLGYTLSKAQEAALRQAYSDTIGVAAKEVVGANFKPFLDRSKLVTKTVNLTYGLYEAVYSASREAMIKELGIPVKSGELIHDLTVEQEAALAERLKAILPVMNTAMSKEEGNVENGILLAKKGRKQNNSAPYKAVVGFGSKLGNGASQLTASGRSMVQTDPGVIAISGSTHALDSFNSHEAQEANHVVNNHDAVGAGINALAQSAELLNKSTWKNTLNYSPLNEAHDALMRVVQGIVAMDQRGELTPEIKTAIKEKLKELSKKNRGSKVESIVDTTAFNIFSEALQANRIKFGAMAQWAVVDQYAMDGGSYQVTDADRQEAQVKLDALTPVRADADRQALDAFASAMFGAGAVSAAPVAPAAAAPKPTVTSLFGLVGTPAIASDTDLVQFFEGNPEATAAEVIKLLGSEGRVNAINRKILQLVSRVVSPDLKIKFVTPNTAPDMVLDRPTTNARGWFVIKNGQEEIYVLSPEFVNSGLTAETLLHELVHAAVARVIDKPSKEAEALVGELEALRIKAQEYATANGLTQYAPALTNVQEFVAWGMSNLGLQRDVLTKITMPSKTGSNRLVNGMQKFISALTGLLFKKPDANIDNGLAVLVSNVSGLFFEASQVNARTGVNLNLAQETVAPIDAYTTLDIHQALDNGTLEPAFKVHLANLLGGIVQSLHGPFGAFAASMRKTEAGNPLAVWLKAMETGQAPFASRIVASGFAGSAQEDFAMQQVEATVKAALDGNEALTKIAYKRLSDLYTEVKSKLKPSDFKSPEDYDFVFKLESDNGDRSDYLARFAALGLANQQFNTMLKMATERDTRRFGEGQTFTQRLENIFEKILAFFNEKVTKTYAGQNADEKLEALVGQLVGIEAKKRHLIKRNATRTNYLAPVEDGARKATEAVRAKVGDIAGSAFVRNNRLAVVRAVGGLARNVANDQVEVLLDGLQRLRDKEFTGRQGIVAGLINDLKGPLSHFNALLRETKRREGDRKAIITEHAKLSLAKFSNAGKGMSLEAKAAVSSVFLRTGLHNLLDTMSFADLEKVVSNSNERNNAITALEDQLSSKVKERYIEQANALGYFKATGKVRNPVLMLNGYLIARMAGTQFKRQISEQEAKQAEPIITSLVALYALKYASVQDLAQAKEVFRTENNRTDGNGVEFVLKLHKQLEAESLQRLFKGNPALMVHGYTPEIVNPHTAIKIADAAEGANLMAQGYSKGAKVSQDAADPEQATRHIYVLRDGGLAPYLTGVFSLTGLQAKGTKKQNGYVNVNTQAGLDNAVLQAEITNAKLKVFQGKNDPRRDLTQQSGNHLVPVFNEMGGIVNWRYMMAESTKNAVLERDNRFENIIGAFAGSIYDKETTQEQNKKAVGVLLDQFKAEYATRKDSYIEVSARSADPEMRAIWNRLPDATKADVRKIWGTDSMRVRSDALDLMFGYRKLSAAEFLMNDPETLIGVQKIMREWFNTYARSQGMNEQEADNYAKRLGVALTKGERAWQEIVREVKDIIVVKTGTVMLGNIWSNLWLLALSGVPLKEMMQSHLVAMKGATAYQRDKARLAELETVLGVGYSQNDAKQIQDEIVRLKDSLSRNPVRELIEAGLMPTIVEDVAAEEDVYSYKSALTRKTERLTNKLNPSIKTASRTLYMAHDTKMYQSLSRITQLSDFVARYTLYQHLVTRSSNPLSQAEAIQEASDAFVNYDIPMHRGMQFTDDMGFTPFMKYFLRIQRVLLKLARENPARVLTTLALNNFMDLGPIVLESSFVQNFGDNPFRSGALQFPGVLDDLATVNAGMALIK